MRWSQTFIPTLKETPAEAEILSHRLLLRAGLIRKLAGGLYTFLPMGLRALHKVETIVREEMDRAGALEILMPALQPPEIWKASGRYETAKDVLFKARDKTRREWVLGPTHEEVVTQLVSGEINSYRQLPINLYHIQTKFRDEIRPRFGLMRAREFIMKDAYSFDVTEESAVESYQKMYEAYVRIFRRCGLDALPVEADSGVMGGNHSHEFMVPAEVGENDIVYNADKSYAANVDKAVSALKSPHSPGDAATLPAVERFPTPGVRTIEELTKPPWNVPARQQIKSLLYRVASRLVLLLLTGADRLNEAKLAGVLGTAEFRPAEPEEIRETLEADPGSLGGVGVDQLEIIADHLLKNGQGLTTGANENDWHVRNVCIERDIKVTRWEDLRTVGAGEPCPVTGTPLEMRPAIEVGHIFKLGTKYSESLNAFILNDQGQQQPAIMGCYGIGVTRTLQAIIEQNHDEQGIRWPVSVAPFTVCITALDATPRCPSLELAETLYRQLTERQIETILDDRDERPGVKFNDSELVGFPLRLAIGPRSLKRGIVEFKPRDGELREVKLEAVLETVVSWIAERQAAAI